MIVKARANAVVLVGPKGSGKSFVGRLLERELGVSFLRVEPIWLALKTAEPDLSGPAYMEKGMDAVLAAARELADRVSAFSLETTGAMDGTEAFIARFADFANPRLINIRAGRDACLRRVRERDQAEHIAVSDHIVAAVHERSNALRLPFELVIENDPYAVPADIAKAVRSLLRTAL